MYTALMLGSTDNIEVDRESDAEALEEVADRMRRRSEVGVRQVYELGELIGVVVSGHPVARRREEDDPGEEWPELVRKYRQDVASEKRHASRVAAVWEAIAREFEGENHLDQVILERQSCEQAAAICQCELGGIGGPRGIGIGDAATVRMSWARKLGAGRRQARDGAAWTAAIEAVRSTVPVEGEALASLLRATATAGFLTDPIGDLAWLIAECTRQAVGASTPAEAHVWAEALDDIAAEYVSARRLRGDADSDIYADSLAWTISSRAWEMSREPSRTETLEAA